MSSETALADSRRRRCPLSSCADAGEEEASQSRLVSVAGGLAGGPWFTEQVVEVRRPEVEERVFEVPQVVRREKVVEEPRQLIQEKVKYIPKYETVERVTHVPKHVTKEIITDVPQVQVVERTVEVPTTVYQDVVIPVPKPVIEERTTEVAKPVFVEKIIEVPRVVHRPCPVDRVVEVPQTRIEYRYRDVPVPRRVVRSVVSGPPPFVHQKQQLPAASVRWKGEVAAPDTSVKCCAFSPRGILATCCPVSLPRASTHKTRIHADADGSSSNPTKYHPFPSPARFYTAPLSKEAMLGKGDEAAGPSPQPYVVEGIEPAADAAGCCTLSPRRHKIKRSELLLAPRGRTGRPIHVRVATLSPRRKTGALGAAPSPRAASVPPTMTTTPPPPPFQPIHVPVYQYQQQLFEEQQAQQETQVQQEQQQAVLEPAEPWIRTKLGDMPFAEFERLNNANSLVSSPRPTPAFSTVTFAPESPRVLNQQQLFQHQQQHAFEQQQQHIAYEQQQQQQQALSEKQRLAQEEAERFHHAEQQRQRLLALQQQQQQEEEARRQQQQREEEAQKLLMQQQQREEEARRAYEQQEQQRREQLRLLEQQRREAEARRQEELQHLQQQLQRQREQQERELQQRREEAQRKQEEERQKLMAKMQQEREQMEQQQRQQQKKEVEELLQMQERQLREHEERQQRFMQEHEHMLANLLQQQHQQQQQLQTELKEHQQRLQEQQQLLRVQQQQALRQLQETHARQQQKLMEEAQRKAEACWLEEDPSCTKQQHAYLPVNGSDDVMIETRFGLMPFRVFQALNETNTLKSVSPVPGVQTHGYTRVQEPTKNAVFMHTRPPLAVQRVVYSNPTPSYIPVTTKQQYYYVQQPVTNTAWAPEASNQWLLPSGEEAESIKSVAQRIGQDAAAAGSHVYGGVKTAVNSEVTQGLFRSVGELVADAYNRIKQRRQ
ncbi:hypothetical protein Emag_000292 [Eimeria magna]